MANLFLNSDNLDRDKSLIIENIKIDSTVANQLDGFLGDIPLSLIISQGDLNGDTKNDLFVQSSILLAEDSLVQENFIILGSDSFPSTVNATQIDGSNGFSLGDSVSFATGFVDINGDELDDILITTIDPVNNAPSTAVILGSNQFPATVDLNTLDGNNGFTFSSNEESLNALSIKGDINNDNINDFALISTITVEDSLQTVNKIVFGKSTYEAEFDVSNLDGTNGFVVDDTAIISGTGVDVNADEFDDLVFYNQTNPISYIVYGRNQFDAELDLNTLTAEGGFTITQEGSRDSDRLFAGFSEDLNGDGVGEIIIQKQVAAETEEGALQPDGLFIIYGSTDNINTNIDLASLDGSNGFTFNTKVELQSLVDLNGDGKQDLFVKNLTDNKTYVVFGSDNLAANFDLTTLDGTNGFVIANTNIEPQTIANAGTIGDVNADEIDDIAIDAEGDNDYILLGSQEAFPASIDLTALNTNAIEISGSKTANGIAGFSDLNGDGADEIIFNSVADAEDETLANSTVVFSDADLSFATNEPPESQTIELFRFRNTSFESGTYVFVAAAERDAILADEDLSNTFALDGQQEDGTVNPAFKASLTQAGDDYIPFYRLKSLDVPGTFLFVSTEEYTAIFAENSEQQDKWLKEGLNEEGTDIAEFYLLDSSAERGVAFNRFQNTQNNTFLYAGPDETQAIENEPNLSSLFNNQGVAFASLT
jgi:hypothetical protein